MITKFGRRFIASYLAGMTSFSRQDIAIGIDSTSVDASGNDTRLGFEFYRLPASFGSIDIQSDGLGGYTYGVIYKTTLPQDVSGVIREVALYPSTRTSINNYDSKFITDFENNIIWQDSVGANPPIVTSPTPRIGSSMIHVNCGQSFTKEYIASISPLDISGYSSKDSLTLAFNQADANLSSIVIKFYSSDTAYHYATFSGTEISTGTGNKILERLLSTFQTSGSPTSLITKVGISVTATSGGTTNVYFDGLRINDEDTFDPKFGMIGRTVLPTPLTKVAGKPVDIEYRLGLIF